MILAVNLKEERALAYRCFFYPPEKQPVAGGGLLYDIRNSFGQREDILVSYLNQLDTVGSSPIRLLKIGNNIIEAKSGESVLEFRELGKQVWRVYGVFDNTYFKHGSVVWSPDMKLFYSVRSAGAPTVEWRRQDDNSMDVSRPSVSDVAMPSVAKSLLEDGTVTKNAKGLALTGPTAAMSARGATSLAKRATMTQSMALKFAFGLTSEEPSVAPSSAS